MTFWVSFFFFSLFGGGCLGLYTLHSSVYLESLFLASLFNELSLPIKKKKHRHYGTTVYYFSNSSYYYMMPLCIEDQTNNSQIAARVFHKITMCKYLVLHKLLKGNKWRTMALHCIANKLYQLMHTKMWGSF